MAQFDVFRNLTPKTNQDIPYLLDVQVDLLEDLSTRVVVPLYRSSTIPEPAKYLNPVFSIANNSVVMSTAELAGIPKNILGEKVTSLIDNRNVIIGALDFLITGF